MYMKTTCRPFHPVLVFGLASLLMWSGCANEQEGLNIRMEAAATILNPILPSTGYSGFVAAQLFQTLGMADPESLVMKPLLVKAIPTGSRMTEGVHRGDLAYEFEIHEAATWDNGSPVTAQDYIFTLKIILHPGIPTPYRDYYQYLSGVDIDAQNPKKFTVFLRQYYILALETLCSTPIYPVYNYDPQGRLKNVALTDLLDAAKSQAFAESANGKAFAEEFTASKYSNEAAFISGSGPYRLKSMNGDQGVVLLKKANWWGDDAALSNPLLGAYPERLVYKIVKDEAAARSLLESGDLDIAVDLSPAVFKEMEQDTHLSRLYDFKTGWAPRYGRLLFNLQHADSILADVRVRQALAYAIDYDYLINTVQQGFAQRVIGPIHPAKSYYAKDLPAYTYNTAEAIRLLTAAGWKDTDGDGVVDKMLNGQRTQLALKLISPNGAKVSELVANSVVEKARQIQVKIMLDPQDISNITKKTRAGDFQMANLGASTQTGLDELKQYYHSASPDNRGRYQNVRLDSILDAIRITENVADRSALYVEAQRILHNDLPAIFLFSSARRYIVSKKFNYVLTANNAGYYEQMFQRKAE